jgi:hypothetical protein
MTRDFSAYTLAELNEALASVNRDKYPDVAVALEAELQSRKESGRHDEEIKSQLETLEATEKSKQKLAKIWLKVIAVYMILTGALIPFDYAAWGPKVAIWLLIGVVFLYVASSVAIGIAFLLDRSWAYLAAVGFHALQVVRLHSEILTWDALSYIGIYAVYGQGGDIGINAIAMPHFYFAIGRNIEFSIGINFVAMAIISCIFMVHDARK